MTRVWMALLICLATSPISVSANGPRDSWQSHITLMTGVPFPEEITCITEKVFHCGFDTGKCEGGISDYPRGYSTRNIYVNFSTKTTIIDKGTDKEKHGTLSYLGDTTFLIRLGEFPNSLGYIVTF